jgi:hypothetical protein
MSIALITRPFSFAKGECLTRKLVLDGVLPIKVFSPVVIGCRLQLCKVDSGLGARQASPDGIDNPV